MQESYRKKHLKPAAAIAAALVIIIGALVALTVVHNNKPYATVSVESDECLEITLNRDSRPLSIQGADNAGKRLAQRIEKGADLSEAIDNILDGMRESGSLSEGSNTVLITADAPENAEALLGDSFEAARNSFTDSRYSGAILTTVASDDKEILRMSRRYHISVGKAEMIADILQKDKTYSTQMLSRLSVNDLNLFSMFRRIRYDNIEIFGTSRGCIAPEEAIGYVSAQAGFTDASATATLGVDRYGLLPLRQHHGKDHAGGRRPDGVRRGYRLSEYGDL